MPQGVLLPLIVASIPAVAAVLAAIVAGFFASRTRRAETEAQRSRDLESRLSDRKYTTYEPMINMLRDMFAGKISSGNPKDAHVEKMAEFSTWIGVYGSDDAVESFHNLMQCIYNNPPTPILLRLYGDFLLAARRDMGYPHTEIERHHLLGMKITDIYKHADVIDPSFEEVCERLNWKAPWLHEDLVPHTVTKWRSLRSVPV